MKRLLVFALLATLAGAAAAEEGDADKGGWSGSLGLSWVTTGGNSDTATIGFEETDTTTTVSLVLAF